MMRVRGNKSVVFAVLLAACMSFGTVVAFGQADSMRPVAGMIESLWAAGQGFGAVNLVAQKGEALAVSSKSDALRSRIGDAVRDGFVLSFNADTARALLRGNQETMTLALPAKDYGKVELELARVDILTPDFTVRSSNGQAVPCQLGAHYRGVVRGIPGSLAAISVFNNEVMGMYSTPERGNVVLGRLSGANPENLHILYAQRDLKKNPSLFCAMPDDQVSIPRQDDTMLPAAAMATCVRIYVEADYDVYKNWGSVQNVTNYVTGFFNQSAILYQNEQIPIKMSQLYVWTKRSPYKGNSSSQLLSSFQKYRTSFNGDLGHLIALRGGGGIAAGFSGFCNATTSQRECFSMIDKTYNNVPTYSWTVMVFTHEMGHLMGSRHTHACVWNGNNTAIDGCYNVEGTCPRPGIPSNGGTIMSYCHLQSVGINFTLGFGPQPGGVIRTGYGNATCLASCP